LAGTHLTIDLGNTRCKLRRWDPERPERAVGATDLPADETLPERLSEWLAEERPRGRIGGAWISSVAAFDVEEPVVDTLRHGLDAPVELCPDPGLVIDCTQPETIGVDRLYAARGALEVVRRSALVVDAGTALTVDALQVATGGRGVFLGGAIAPGPLLLARSLAEGGARLQAVEPHPDAPALGKHTRAALEAGVAVGFRGAALHLVERIAAEAGLGDAPVVLTGGARAFLRGAADELGRPEAARRAWREEPELVHRGLLACALAAEPGP